MNGIIIKVINVIQIYKSIDEKLVKLKDFENNTWINLCKPTNKEVADVSKKLKIDSEYLINVLDPETQSEVEYEEGITSIIIDIPKLEKDDESELYHTIPLGIFIIRDKYIVTVCGADSDVFNDFKENRVKKFSTSKRSKFIIQLLYRISLYYLRSLKFINRETDRVETLLYKSPKNKDLLRLLAIEKSLVYFKTSVKANQIVLEKILKGNIIKLYEEDNELLDETIIENKQAIEMTEIYSNIVSILMNAFSSIISNNLNLLMKFLTGITIVLSIPTMVSSFMGMNVDLGPITKNQYAFLGIIILSLLLSIIIYLVLKKKDML